MNNSDPTPGNTQNDNVYAPNNQQETIAVNVNPAPATIPQTKTSGTEEFTYKPKAGFGIKKALKTILIIISFALLTIPLYFVFKKVNPFAPKVETKKGEITWWVISMDEGVINSIKNEYLEKNPGVKINIVMQSEIDYGERLLNKLKEGGAPDIFSIHGSWVPMYLDHLEPIPASVYPKEDFTKDFYPAIIKQLNTTKGIVAMPLEYDAITLYINEEIFSRSGKTVPRTWDQFTPLAKELTTKDAKNRILQSGAAMGWTVNIDYWPETIALLMLQNKSNLYTPSSTSQYAHEAMKTYGEFRSSLKTWDDSLPRSTIAFAEGKVAMMFATAGTAGEIKKINPNLKFKTVVVPQIRRDDPNEPEYSYASFWVQSVWNRSGDKDLAWSFLKYLSSEESLVKMYDLSISTGAHPKAYPRISMREKLINDRVFGSVVALAPIASSWYLYDVDLDGENGITTTVRNAYKSAVDTVSKSGGNATTLFKTLSSEVKKALAVYNVTK